VNSELETDQVLNDLMGKDPAARFKFIMERSKDATSDALDV
jgi:DNA gyrase subunit B